MKKILHITASVNGESSQSTRLSSAIVNRIKRAHPNSTVKPIDLSQEEFPHLSGVQVGSYFTPQDLRTSVQHDAIAASDRAIADLLDADVIVIGVPLYNLGVPSSLKSWIDHIVRVGKTFQYVDGVPTGLVSGKKVYLAIASGSVFSEGPMQSWDFSEPYLRSILGFIGLTDIAVFRVEGTAMAAYKESAVPKALAAVDAYAFA